MMGDYFNGFRIELGYRNKTNNTTSVVSGRPEGPSLGQVDDGISFWGTVSHSSGQGKKKEVDAYRKERVCVETRNDGLRSVATGYFVGARPEKCCAVYSNRIGRCR